MDFKKGLGGRVGRVGFFEAAASRRQKPCSGRDQTVRLRHAAKWPDGPRWV